MVLGRGGSDATAVALAAALHAKCCVIYSDVPGIFTADPKIVPDARLMSAIAYEEMLELASSGAQIMMGRAVEIARKTTLEVHVKSSFEDLPGTVITNKEKILESTDITGIAANRNVVLVDLVANGTGSKNATKVLRALAKRHINIKLITSAKSFLTLVIDLKDLQESKRLLSQLEAAGSICNYNVNSGIAQLSVVGHGISENYGIAYEIWQVLPKGHVEILLTSTSEIKISVIIDETQLKRSMILLHEHFGLHRKNGEYDRTPVHHSTD